MKFIWITILILYCPFIVFTQIQPDEQDVNNNLIDKDLIENHETRYVSQEKPDLKHDKPLNFNFFTGTGFTSSKGFGSASNMFFGTSVSYLISPRFNLEFGTSLNFSRYTDLPVGFDPEGNLSESNLHTTSVTLYTRGNYYLSSRLTLSGMAFKQLSPCKYPSVNPSFLNYNREGMSLGLNYRLFENFHIGAQFNYIRNDNPFYPSRLTNPVIDNYYR